MLLIKLLYTGCVETDSIEVVRLCKALKEKELELEIFKKSRSLLYEE